MTTVTRPDTGVQRAAERVVGEESAASDDTAAVDPHPERTREFTHINLSRMRTDWTGEDAIQIQALKSIVEGRILHLFPEAFVLMNDLWDIVREKECDADGVPLKDANGFDVWRRTSLGAYLEDYTRLGIREREDFLFRITTGVFEWEQRQADLWGEAMFAKAQWEEAMATGFLETNPGGKNTDEARTQRGKLASTDHRYFAIFQTLLSRRADAVVGSLKLLGQRLKDTTV